MDQHICMCDAVACTSVATVTVALNGRHHLRCASCALMAIYVASAFNQEAVITPFAEDKRLLAIWNAEVERVGHA